MREREKMIVRSGFGYGRKDIGGKYKIKLNI